MLGYAIRIILNLQEKLALIMDMIKIILSDHLILLRVEKIDGEKIAEDKQEISKTPVKDTYPSTVHRFKPGQSGNPNGRPKGSGLTDTLKKLLREPDPDDPDKTTQDRLIEAAMIHAKKGDFKFFQEIFNRCEGKVPDRIVGAFNHGIMDELDDDDLKAIIEAGKLRDQG